MTEDYHHEVNERRKLFNELQELKGILQLRLSLLIKSLGNIRVFCRVRPLSMEDKIKEGEKSVRMDFGENDIYFDKKLYQFDRIFSPPSSQGMAFGIYTPAYFL